MPATLHNQIPMKTRSLIRSITLGVLTAMGALPTAEAQIGRANNTTPFNQDGAWTGGVAPTPAQVAGFSAINTATSATSTIDAAVNFQIAGITYTSNPGTNLQISGGAGSSLTIGASGIDTSGGTRVLTINTSAPVVLSANQTWTTGSAPDNNSQIVVNSVVSGSGSLTINGTSGFSLSPVYLNNVNTFTGGVTLNSGGALRFGGGTPTFSGNLTTASSIGTGNLTINGGTIFGGGGTLAASTTTINGNVAINHATSGLNGRFTIAGGTLDLAGGNRTVSVGGFKTALVSLSGGQESIRFVQTAGAPTISVTNGTLRLVRGSTGTAADFVGVNFGTGSNFAAGSGLAIGENVITSMATGNPFGTTAGAQPHVTVESGGYFNMSDSTNARSPSIRSLAGAGTVTSLANSGAPATSTLTINSQSGDNFTFSGSIVDGSSLNALLGTSATNVAVAVTKTGAGTQKFSGTNSYTGITTVSAGTLLINGNNSGATGNVQVSNTGTVLGGSGTVGGNTTFNSQTRLAPGDGAGTMTFLQGLTLVGFAAVDFQGGDLINAGTLSLSATWSLALGTGFQDGGSTVIFDYGTAGTFDAGYINAGRINAAGLGFVPVNTLSLTDTGTSIVLNGISAIPEPSTLALSALGLGAAGLLLRRRA